MAKQASTTLKGDPPSVAIVLLNWNCWPLTLTCLESLFRLDYPNYTVIVCDNASSDGSMSELRAWAAGRQSAPPPSAVQLHALVDPPVPKPVAVRELERGDAASHALPPVPLTLIQTGANLGFAGGCNVGIRHALARKADYVWILNNDTVASPDSLLHLVAALRSDPEIGIVGSTLLSIHRPSQVLALGGGRLRRATGATRHIGAGESWPPHEPLPAPAEPMDYVVGASMLVSRRVLETIGLMDEGYFLYYEELDWAFRLRPSMRIGYAPASVIYHHEGGTTGGIVRGHYYRSLIRFTWRHNRRWLPLVLLRMVLRVPEAMLSRNWPELGALLSLLRPANPRSDDYAKRSL